MLQTGEADWAWNLQIEPAILNSLQSGGRGQIVTWLGGGTEKLIINHTDPQTEQDDQYSTYKIPHAHFQELKVRQALAYAIQRDAMATQLYGPGGKETAYTMNENSQYMPPDLKWEYNLDKARQLLDEVGAAPGPDGIRVFNDRRMSWLYGSSTNSVRQKEQEIIKAALQQIGIEVEIKAVDASAYFAANNTDSFQQLRADLGMETNAAGICAIFRPIPRKTSPRKKTTGPAATSCAIRIPSSMTCTRRPPRKWIPRNIPSCSSRRSNWL